MTRLLCLLTLAAVAVGCQKSAPTPAASAKPAATTAPACAAPASVPPRRPRRPAPRRPPAPEFKPVAAVLPETCPVNGDAITKAEFEGADPRASRHGRTARASRSA